METKKFKPIKINFTEEEHQVLKSHAEQCGMSMVELCRFCVSTK